MIFIENKPGLSRLETDPEQLVNCWGYVLHDQGIITKSEFIYPLTPEQIEQYFVSTSREEASVVIFYSGSKPIHTGTIDSLDRTKVKNVFPFQSPAVTRQSIEEIVGYYKKMSDKDILVTFHKKR